MKFDKETVIKHHFWFLLGPAALLALVGIFLLMTVVSAEIAKTRKDLETKLSGSKITDAKNDEWLRKIGKENEEAEKMKEKVWGAAYESQKDIFTWPEKVEQEFDFKNGYFASEIKEDKSATPVDFEAEKRKVVRRFAGTVEKVTKRWMLVNDGKQKHIFRPTRRMKLGGEGKNAPNTFLDIPEGSRVSITYVQGKYFDDPLTQDEEAVFANSEDGYRTQIADIISQVKPMDARGQGIVQLRDWFFALDPDGQPKLPTEKAPFFRYVAKKEWDTDRNISSEAWIAQEDLWIQRELYRLVQQANDMVSVMKESAGGSAQSKTFANPYWKLELSLTGQNQLKARIWNLLPRRQKLDIFFDVSLRKGKEERIQIPGEPIDPGKDWTVTISITGPAPTGIYKVEQVINWETAAVKRIDHISIGSLVPGDCCQSHRTYPEGLKPYKAEAAKEAAPGGGNPGMPGGGAPGGGAPGGGMPGGGAPGGGMPGMPGGGMPGGKGGAAAESKKTRNGLSKDRYIEIPSDQVRRVPFGIAMIVDQEHLDRILYVFSKSPLRILTTQVIINRYPGSVRPNIAQDSERGKGIGGGLQPFGGGFPGGFGGRPGGFGGFGANNAPASASVGPESNMELVIYGIASLYQRYPPRPKTP